MQHTTQIIAASNPSAIIDRAALKSAVAKVILAVERKSTFPIMGNVRVTGTGDGITITGTDLDQEISAFVPGAGDVRFDTTIPAYVLKDLLTKAKPSDHVAIEDDGAGRCELDFEGLKVELQTLQSEDFPAFAAPGDDIWQFALSRDELYAALHKVAFAMSGEEVRYYLNGIYMHVIEGKLRFVATDGHRMALYDLAHPVMKANMPGIIMPRATVANLLKIGKAKDLPDCVRVTVTERQCRFVFGPGVAVASTVIDGTFPDYERIIPRSGDKTFSACPAAIASACKEVSIVSSEKGRAIKFAFADGTCRLTVENPDQGKASTVLAGDWSGEALEISVNGQYVQDACAGFDDGEIDMTFSDYGSPFVVSQAGSGLRVVQMPMRV